MSDHEESQVENTEVVDAGAEPEITTSESPSKTEPQEATVEGSKVTITVSKRVATIGAVVLAGFVGFIIGAVGTAHHMHDGRDGRGLADMRMDDFGGQGQFGPGQGLPGQGLPGQGMMPGGPGGHGFGPDDQRGPSQGLGNQGGMGMMPGGPGQIVTATPLPSTN
jgi:hypothetical protein